ncbi:MAG: M20/M25/M40 family metallo-hydrolase [Clostridiales bacterium]|nr:MAG: M20/M25/M40 family metallo-hydrolase [Clostridiales bacterium]
MTHSKLPSKTTWNIGRKNNGFMHACGHDFHIATALYCAAVIKNSKNEIKGNVRFIFFSLPRRKRAVRWI